MKFSPVIPKDAADPANQRGNLKRAMSDLKQRFKHIEKEVVKLVADQKQYQKQTQANTQWRPLVFFTNSRFGIDTVKSSTAVNVAYYEYLIDDTRLQQIDRYLERLLYGDLLESFGDMPSRWFFKSYLSQSFNQAVNESIQSYQNQADSDVLGEDIARQLLTMSRDEISPQIMQSLGIVYSRTFNNMKGLTDSMKSDLADTLTRGMESGFGIRQITADIKKRVGVGFSRAQRIARTEILNAFRTTQRAKTKEVNETIFDDSPFVFRQLWFSALAGTSRPNHVARHGSIYTQQEVELFYSERGNSVNCLCSQSPILVDRETGEPVNEKVIERMKEQKKAWQGRV